MDGKMFVQLLHPMLNVLPVMLTCVFAYLCTANSESLGRGYCSWARECLAGVEKETLQKCKPKCEDLSKYKETHNGVQQG